MDGPDAQNGDRKPLLERFQNLIFGALIVAIVAGAIILAASRPEPVRLTILPPPPTATPGPTATHAPVRVYVTGAVNRPGVYELPWGAIARDAVLVAGGARASADLARVNLAHVLRDGDQIHVPEPEAEITLATSTGLVNINAATLEELDTLPGIGPGLAQRIIDYREANGPFATIEDIMDVSGIGPSTFERMKDRLTVE